jgi:hypothetical protein
MTQLQERTSQRIPPAVDPATDPGLTGTVVLAAMIHHACQQCAAEGLQWELVLGQSSTQACLQVIQGSEQPLIAPLAKARDAGQLVGAHMPLASTCKTRKTCRQMCMPEAGSSRKLNAAVSSFCCR